MYTPEEIDALLELNSFMLNEVTEPAMRLFENLFHDSCAFVYNIEYAVYRKKFYIIRRDNSTLDPLDPQVITDYGKSCDRSLLAFPVNCFEDKKGISTVQEEPDGFGHANLVIVNKILQTVEHFDPHGAKMNQLTQTEQREFENAVKQLFVRGPWKDYTYYPPREVCPTTGIQNLMIRHGQEPRIRNTCRIWCYQFLMERLKNPQLTVDEINRQNLDKLQVHNPLVFSQTIDKFIIDFIANLYKDINVKFEHKDSRVCLRWPQEKYATYCVKKRPSGPVRQRRKSQVPKNQNP